MSYHQVEVELAMAGFVNASHRVVKSDQIGTCVGQSVNRYSTYIHQIDVQYVSVSFIF
jgi:hypothetical protein